MQTETIIIGQRRETGTLLAFALVAVGAAVGALLTAMALQAPSAEQVAAICRGGL